MYSPNKKTVYYNPRSINSTTGIWSLCHEIAHAKLNHCDYEMDIDLLKMEVDAWNEAVKIIESLEGVPKIDEEHIDNCLETYREWIYRRSLCPSCKLSAAQTNKATYTCIQCLKSWHVPESQIDKIEKQTLLVG